LSARGHRFCPSASGPIVYFAQSEAFSVDAIAVPVFQKQAGVDRTVCYCFQIGEADLRREIQETGGSTASKRVSAHVAAGRCACEIKNPQGSCCLGNLSSIVTAIVAEFRGVKVERGL
jgi:hypothetical protein